MRRLNRKHKDRLFLRVFSEKGDLLNLYNAVNGSSYTNPDDLEITTLEDIIYMGMKNDVSFLSRLYQELMAQCRKLNEYAQFIAKVREYQDEGLSIPEAVDAAVDVCIEQNILADILSSHKAEVIALFMTDYDAQAHMEMERDEWTEYGIERGETIKLISMVRKKLAKANSPETIADALEEDVELVEKICETIGNHPDKDDRGICDVISPPLSTY